MYYENLATLERLCKNSPNVMLKSVWLAYKEKDVLGTYKALSKVSMIVGSERYKFATIYINENGKQEEVAESIRCDITILGAILVDSLVKYKVDNLETIDVTELVRENFFKGSKYGALYHSYFGNIKKLYDENYELIFEEENEGGSESIKAATETSKKIANLIINSGSPVTEVDVKQNIAYLIAIKKCNELIESEKLDLALANSILTNIKNLNYFVKSPNHDTYSPLIIKCRSAIMNLGGEGNYEILISCLDEYIPYDVHDLYSFITNVAKTVKLNNAVMFSKSNEALLSAMSLYLLVKVYIYQFENVDSTFYDMNYNYYRSVITSNNSDSENFLDYITGLENSDTEHVRTLTARIANKNKIRELFDSLSKGEIKFDPDSWVTCERFHLAIYFSVYVCFRKEIENTFSAIEGLEKELKKRVKMSVSSIRKYVELDYKEDDTYINSILNKYSTDKVKELIANFTYIIMSEWDINTVKTFGQSTSDFLKIYATGYNYATASTFNNLEVLNRDKIFKKMEATAANIRKLTGNYLMDLMKEIYSMFLHTSYNGIDSIPFLDILNAIIDLLNVFSEELTLNLSVVSASLNPKKLIVDSLLSAFTNIGVRMLYELLTDIKLGGYTMEGIYTSLLTLRNVLKTVPTDNEINQSLISLEGTEEYKTFKESGYGIFFNICEDDATTDTNRLLLRCVTKDGFSDTLSFDFVRSVYAEIKETLGILGIKYDEAMLFKNSFFTFCLFNYIQTKHYKSNKSGSVLGDIQLLKKYIQDLDVFEMKIFTYEYMKKYSSITKDYSKFSYKYPEIIAYKKYYQYTTNQLSQSYIDNIDTFFSKNTELLKKANNLLSDGFEKYVKYFDIIERRAAEIVAGKVETSDIYTVLSKFFPTTELLIGGRKELIIVLDFLIDFFKGIFGSIKEGISFLQESGLSLSAGIEETTKSYAILKKMNFLYDIMIAFKSMKMLLLYMDENFNKLSTTCSIM